MDDTTRLLQDALQLLLATGWTQKAFARDPYEKWTSWKNPEAKAFSITGVVKRTHHDHGKYMPETLVRGLEHLAHSVPRQPRSLVEFNDDKTTTLSDVVNLFTLAIERSLR